MKRDIVHINEELCNGCGECIPNCHEGALQIIDGKARLVSELMCDGLGACIGHCPLDAISIEQKEAEAYDEIKVMEEMIPKGFNTIVAHLTHLKEHNESGFFNQAMDYLKENQEKLPFTVEEMTEAIHAKKEAIKIDPSILGNAGCGGSCPGSAAQEFQKEEKANASGSLASQLSHWPVQMHLINPASQFFQGADLLIAADCVAFSMGNFHQDYLKNKALVIACPKLDQGLDIYLQKLIALIEQAKVNTITLMMMEVPCCGGLESMLKQALAMAQRKVPVKRIVVSIKGDVLAEEWM
jgi:NAD-dependent dihydropyrimidine dehydrogenase PreA subunit